MRSKISLLLVILMSLSVLSACGSVAVQESSVSTAETEVTVLSEELASEQVQVDNTTSNELSKPDEEIEFTEEIIEENTMEIRLIYVTIGETILTAKLEDNSSADALIEKLNDGDIIVDMSDYASFEKVGSLGFSLPRNDEQYTTKAGDIILYQGNNIVFYYDTNSWNFTKLGEFQDVMRDELIEIFGDGSITAKISVNK